MNGYHLERVDFDPQLWESIRSRCLDFWRYYVVPAVDKSNMMLNTDTSETDTADSEQSDFEAIGVGAVGDHEYTKPLAKEPRTCPLQLPPYPVVCLCGVCHNQCSSGHTLFDRQ